MNLTARKRPTATTGAIDEVLLRQWLQLAGGSLPEAFLQQQGLDPALLVSWGWLSAESARWSASYVAGPLLFRPCNAG